MESITLSLISHTNVGKTTLARTLLGRDVGEVRDEAHVTMESERHVLLETESARLVLWDTPGFGDSARLLDRLRRQDSPLGWFLHQVWDRLRDRPLYSSQEALRNVREEADVVLYLVNASEHPEEAGYVAPELEILGYAERPILVLLNQTGPAGTDLAAQTGAWETFLADRPGVHGPLALDAFGRCWVQEGVLFGRIGELLPEERRAAMTDLARAWRRESSARFERTVEGMARLLAETAADREATRGGLGSIADRRQAMTALAERLARRERTLWDEVLLDHRIEGSAAAELRRAIADFEVQGGAALDEKTGALVGGLVTGALSGLAADVLSGGLSLGGGMIAGGLIGALGGAGLTKAYRTLQGAEEPAVSWSAEALADLARRTAVRYLAVAHFGRGKGAWRDEAEPESWSRSVERQLTARPLVAAPAEALGANERRMLELRVKEGLGRLLREVLKELYPEARDV